MSPRKIDLQEAKKMLKEHQPSFDLMEAAEAVQDVKWQDEIAMLEGRVKDCFEMVDLENGDQIAVRTALSEKEMKELGKIEKRKGGIFKEIKKKSENPDSNEEEIENLQDSISDLTYRQIEVMTANPLITADWLRKNQDKWPVNDALVIMQSASDRVTLRRLNRAKELASFRDS